MAGITFTAVTPLQPDYSGNRTIERFNATNGAPTIASTAAAGSASGGVNSFIGTPTDAGGRLQIVGGTTITAGGGTAAVVTFANTFGTVVHPLITPGDSTTTTFQQGTAALTVVGGSTGFSLVGGSITSLGTLTFNWELPNDVVVTKTVTTNFLRTPDEVMGPGIKSATFTTSTVTLGVRPDWTSSVLEVRGQV